MTGFPRAARPHALGLVSPAHAYAPCVESARGIPGWAGGLQTPPITQHMALSHVSHTVLRLKVKQSRRWGFRNVSDRQPKTQATAAGPAERGCSLELTQ